MNPASRVSFAVDSDEVGWITFAPPGGRANIFNAETQLALAAAIDAADESAARALVITSSHDRIFVAGADLHWLERLSDPSAATAFSRLGQMLFQRLADFRGPTVCAIHGACAGGGYEMALACDWRIASEAAVTRIGLPETTLGTIPGWGGCVRLPRLIGAEAAIDHIVAGQLISATQARRGGLIDEMVGVTELKQAAKTAALRLANSGRLDRRPPPIPAPDLWSSRRDAVAGRTRGREPAPVAAISAVEQGLSLPVLDALAVEARLFGEVTADRTCKNLIRVFFLKDAAKKPNIEMWFPPAKTASGESAASPIYRVGIVGAGVMGSGIAHWLASRGFDVVLRDVQVEFIERALGVMRGLLDDGVRRGKVSSEEAQIVLRRIRATTAWDGFADRDLVIEAIAEDVAAKRSLFTEVAGIVRSDAVLASNTSALPIRDIAGHVHNPERTLGIHFFNPVSRMPLVELVLDPQTSAATATAALEFVRHLDKAAVICRSSPGFVVTRVLFFYLNAAVGMWERGLDAATIDGAMRDFGWPMGPLRLIDEVGVDVTASIFHEMAHYFPARFTPSRACAEMLAAGLKGRKNGASRGFYRYADAQERANEDEVRAIVPSPGLVRGETRGAREIIDGLMHVMVEEAQRCVSEGVVASADDVDFALLSGAGFPAFRGGLLHWARNHEPTTGAEDA